jgi:N-hydroxyarylamine O-acetyltransferase
VDLDAYFDRIGFTGRRAATLDTLCALTRLHPDRIAFENLDVLLGRPIRLDPASLWQKLVHGRRGGYCYEHNSLLLHVLLALGFEAAPLLARVLWQRDPARPIPRTHMLLRVDLPVGAYVADVGFGVCNPTAPLALKAEAVQQTPLETFRLLAVNSEYQLQVRLANDWTDLYRFSPQPVLLVDCDPPNWFHSTCPDSPFTQHLLAGRAEADRRHFLLDTTYCVTHPDGTVDRQIVAEACSLLALLEGPFLIGFADQTERALAMGRLDRFVAETAG